MEAEARCNAAYARFVEAEARCNAAYARFVEAEARCNAAYARFVEAEAARLGEAHPLFRTQYSLEPLQGGRGFFTQQQQTWLQGKHRRLHRPLDAGVCVAGIDVAGEAEEDPLYLGGDAALRVREPRRDSTVVTIARVDYSQVTQLHPQPQIHVVEHVWWTGRNHASLVGELAALLGSASGGWRCRKVVVDATGVGAGVASMLERMLGGSIVQPFLFTATSKSKLGFDLLAAANAQRLRVYARDGSPEVQEFWHEVEHAQAQFRSNRQMNFLCISETDMMTFS